MQPRPSASHPWTPPKPRPWDSPAPESSTERATREPPRGPRPHHSRCRIAVAGVYSEFSRIRSEEHTSELQSPDHLVCRLLLEKKKKQTDDRTSPSQCN